MPLRPTRMLMRGVVRRNVRRVIIITNVNTRKQERYKVYDDGTTELMSENEEIPQGVEIERR
jgi:hypothetical protein